MVIDSNIFIFEGEIAQLSTGKIKHSIICIGPTYQHSLITGPNNENVSELFYTSIRTNGISPNIPPFSAHNSPQESIESALSTINILFHGFEFRFDSKVESQLLIKYFKKIL